MPRELFVDTNVLIGMTFFSDMWFREARPAFDNEHRLHASELVVYEYCCAPNPFGNPPESPEDLDIDWSENLGVVGKVRTNLSKPYREYRSEIRKLDDREVSLDRAIEEFVEFFAIRDKAVPQIRTEFEREFESKAVTRQYICEFASELIDRILRACVVVKEALSKLVEVHPSEYHTAESIRRKWIQYPENPPEEPDLSIVVDGTRVLEKNRVNTILSGDSDILALQEVANEYFRISILSLADEYSV